jgi:hypothetical protein
VLAVFFGIAVLGSFSKDIASLTKGVDDKFKTELISDSVLEIIKFYILTANYDSNSLTNNSLVKLKYSLPEKIIVDNRWYKINKNIRFRMMDTSAMVNVFRASPSIIANFLAKDSQKQLKYTIKDSIKDWEDDDDVVNLNGAEGARYLYKKNRQFKIRNSFAIQDINELSLINGIDYVDEIVWQGLKSRLFYGEIVSINLALIDSGFLSILFNISESEALGLISLRETQFSRYISLISSKDKFDSTNMGFYLSFQFKIEIEVIINGAKSKLVSLISFTPTNEKVYTVIKYILI